MFVSILILVLAVLIIAESCATDKMAYISEEYAIYGIWINPDYNSTAWAGKIEFHPNGKFEAYCEDTSTLVAV
jgi:hypothetical protein